MTLKTVYFFIGVFFLTSSGEAITKKEFLESLSPHALTALNQATTVLLDTETSYDVKQVVADVVYQMTSTGGYKIDDYSHRYEFRSLDRNPQKALEEKSAVVAALLSAGATSPKENYTSSGHPDHDAACKWLIQYGRAETTYNVKALEALKKSKPPLLESIHYSLFPQSKTVYDLASEITKKVFMFDQNRFIEGLPLTKREKEYLHEGIDDIPATEREKVITLFQRLVSSEDRLNLINMFFNSIAKIPNTERESVFTLSQRLFTDTMDSYDRTRILVAVARVAAVNRERLITFLLNNHMTDLFYIEQLSNVPNPADWQQTLASIRGVSVNRIIGLQNQTVHDKEFEASLETSLTALEKRYSHAPKALFGNIVDQFRDSIPLLAQQNLLKPTEAKIVDYFFTEGMARLKSNGDTTKITTYLNLVWNALTDKQAFKTMTGNDLSDQYIRDRLASWFRSGPMDAQLAYLLDNTGAKSTYKDKKTLLKAMEVQTVFDALIIKGESCVGGSYNRLIEPLDRIHPDVTLERGKGSKFNQERYTLENDLANKTKEILKAAEEEGMSEDKVEEHVKKELQKFVEIQIKDKAYPNMDNDAIQKTLEAYLVEGVGGAMLAMKGLAEIDEYVQDPTLFQQDLKNWLDLQPEPENKNAVKEKAESLMNEIIAAQSITIGDKDKNGLIERAKQEAAIILYRYRTDKLKANIKVKLDEEVKALEDLPPEPEVKNPIPERVETEAEKENKEMEKRLKAMLENDEKEEAIKAYLRPRVLEKFTKDDKETIDSLEELMRDDEFLDVVARKAAPKTK